jgi:hypothetical protein
VIRVAAALAAVAAIALGASACGGSDDAPSKSEFTRNVEQICKDTQERLTNVGKGARTADEIASAVDKVINESQKSVDKLKELDLPEGDARDTAESFVKATTSDVEDKGIPALEKLRDALKKNDQAAARKAAVELQSIQSTNADRYARELGATACLS